MKRTIFWCILLRLISLSPQRQVSVVFLSFQRWLRCLLISKRGIWAFPIDVWIFIPWTYDTDYRAVCVKETLPPNNIDPFLETMESIPSNSMKNKNSIPPKDKICYCEGSGTVIRCSVCNQQVCSWLWIQVCQWQCESTYSVKIITRTLVWLIVI